MTKVLFDFKYKNYRGSCNYLIWKYYALINYDPFFENFEYDDNLSSAIRASPFLILENVVIFTIIAIVSINITYTHIRLSRLRDKSNRSLNSIQVPFKINRLISRSSIRSFLNLFFFLPKRRKINLTNSLIFLLWITIALLRVALKTSNKTTNFNQESKKHDYWNYHAFGKFREISRISDRILSQFPKFSSPWKRLRYKRDNWSCYPNNLDQ